MKRLILLILFFLCGGWYIYFIGLSKEDSVYVAESKLQEAEVRKSDTKPLLFVGDIMLGRYVETLSLRAANDTYPFTTLRDYLGEHVTIANLEGPIPQVHVPTPINGFSFSFPSSTPLSLKQAGITAVSLANNHMFDKGRSGYQATKQALDSEGVAHFGGYAPTVGDYFETTLGTKKVVVFGITMIATGFDEQQSLAIAKKLRSEHRDAYLIAFLHWGDEYVTQNIYQRSFAYSLIDLGVDSIIGAHPHVVQGIELYQGKPIFYSLGNFVFDQYWRDELEDGIMVRLSENKKEYIYEIIPVRSERSVPGIATTTKRLEIISRISNQSPSTLQPEILKEVIKIPK